jgi:hypothetical protein
MLVTDVDEILGGFFPHKIGAYEALIYVLRDLLYYIFFIYFVVDVNKLVI